MRWVAIVFACALGAGCYGPSIATGAPCSPSGACPMGQRCDSTGTCRMPDIDAATRDSGDATDDATDGAPLDGVLGAWGTPVALSVNTGGNDSDGSLTADGLELFFMSDRPGGAGGLDLYKARRTTTSAAFGPVTWISELSSNANEYGPEISADGLTLYFASDRGPVITGFEIYRATRPDRASAFQAPVIESGLSTTADDINVALSADGLVAVVDRSTTASGRELYAYTRPSPAAAWSAPTHLTELGGAANDASPTLDATGLVIYFQSDRLVSGSNDLYVASRGSTSAPFSAPMPVVDLDTTGNDANPFISGDVRRIVFSRGPQSSRDLYEATR